MGAFRRWVRKMLAVVKLDAPILLYTSSGITAYGWRESYFAQESINRNAEPIPWNTYAFISFIEPRLKPTFRLFEYGCGNSTLWYAQRVGQVVSVEHDEGWAQKIRPRLPQAASIHVKKVDAGYIDEVKHHGLFDVIVIDGEDRLKCADVAVDHLKADGIIVWDNAEWVDMFSAVKEKLSRHGFRPLEFESMGPINLYLSKTVIFYRSQNCLGI